MRYHQKISSRLQANNIIYHKPRDIYEKPRTYQNDKNKFSAFYQEVEKSKNNINDQLDAQCPIRLVNIITTTKW